MKIACWNIRGLNMPLKQNGVAHLLKQHSIDVMGVLETKLNQNKLQRIMRTKFGGWMHINNFHLHRAGRILVLWNPAKARLEELETTPQAIHCTITCKVTSITFHVSFIYAFHTIVSRRPLWENIQEVSSNCTKPWVVIGDFNSVLSPDEKSNGTDVTPYEVKDFLECSLASGLSDIRSIGCFFTWSNNTVWSKIDRAMVNNLWLQAGFFGLANFLNAGCLSDHSPCIVSLLQEQKRSSKPFRFYNMWAMHDDFPKLVATNWSTPVEGFKQFVLAKRLQSLKGQLKLLNEKHYSHISSRAAKANSDLKDAQLELHDHPRDVHIQNKVAKLRKEAMCLSDAERCFYYQQAKCTHLKQSDRCTKFFHGLVKRNTRRNHIAAICKTDGMFTLSQEQVADEFVKYYEQLLGNPQACEPLIRDILGTGPLVSPDQIDALTKDISVQEIRKALFDIGDDKSPGPDGYTSCFFKKAWQIVGDDFCGAIEEFFSSGSLLKQCNHTVIALVPKAQHAPTVGDFRPIACCNVTYKVITKIIASRLGPVLDTIVDQAQAAFVEGRSMTENIHLAQELLRQYNRKRVSPRCLLKIDLRKAYDSIDWKFLENVLTGLGFPRKFIGWVMACVTTPTYSIALNGSLFGHITGRKGLRQGDPLSPFLFVLCLEYFSRSLKVVTENTHFNYHPKCSQLKITHLAFADDLMLMARGDAISVGILMDCLNDFGDVSGLRANVSKSSLYTAGITGTELEEIKALTNIPTGTMPFRYLGIPLAAEKLKVNFYAPFIDKIAAYINAWTSASLSYAGRSELIKSVLQGVECFWLSIFPIPAAVISRITRLCRAFLWGSKKPLVAWNEVCLPKSEGGLGFRDTKCWNTALLTKALWNIHAKKDTLWVRWINQVYLKGQSLWDWSPNKGDSPLLKRLFGIKHLICQMEGTPQCAIERLSSWVRGTDLNTACAYDFFRPKGTKMIWAKDVWSSCIAPKHSFVLWLSVRSKLLTKDNVKHIDIDKNCVLCGTAAESIKHLFFDCNFSSNVWNQVRIWLNIKRLMSTLCSALKYLKKEARGTTWHSKVKKVALATTIYQIWTARNRRLFEGLKPTPASVIRQIKTQVYKLMFSLYPNVLIQFESLGRNV